MPQGAAGDSNAGTVTDPCGVTTYAAYSGQWQYKELISDGVRRVSFSLLFIVHWCPCPAPS